MGPVNTQVQTRFRRLTQPGTRPGTIVVDPASPHPAIRVIRYGPEQIDEQEDVAVQELPELLGEYPVTWVDIVGLGDADVIKEAREQAQPAPG